MSKEILFSVWSTISIKFDKKGSSGYLGVIMSLFKISFLLAITFCYFVEVAAQNQHEQIYSIKVILRTGETIIQTGFFMKGKVGIITALHGVAGAKRIVASNVRTTDVINDLDIAFVDVERDIAVLQSDKLINQPGLLKIGIEKNTIFPTPRQDFDVIGYPKGAEQYSKPVKANVVPKKRLLNLISQDSLKFFNERKSPNTGIDVITLDGNIIEGYSGAPVLDKQRRVIGVVSGGIQSGAICWAIPIKDIELVKKDNVEMELRRLASITTKQLKELFGARVESSSPKVAQPQTLNAIEFTDSQEQDRAEVSMLQPPITERAPLRKNFSRNPSVITVERILEGKSSSPNSRIFEIILSNDSDKQILLGEFDIKWQYFRGYTTSIDHGSILVPIAKYIIDLPINTSEQLERSAQQVLYPVIKIPPKTDGNSSLTTIQLQIYYTLSDTWYHPCSDWNIFFSISIIDNNKQQITLFDHYSWKQQDPLGNRK